MHKANSIEFPCAFADDLLLTSGNVAVFADIGIRVLCFQP